MAFIYKNTEKRVHGGKHVTQKVHIVGNKGFKSVSRRHKNKTRTVKVPLTRGEICEIRKGKLVRGLFDACHNKL